MQLDLTDNERAVLIAAMRALAQRDLRWAETLNAILEKLEPQKPKALPDNASTG